MKVFDTKSIRNVALIGHSGEGKTSLAEAMLFEAKTISRLGKVDDGSSTMDFDDEEIKRKINENKKQENKFISKIINLKINTKKENTNKTSKIISIAGNNGQAKALLTIKISKKLKRKKLKEDLTRRRL